MRRDLSQPLDHLEFSVAPEEAGMRLDHWLQARVRWRSRADLQRRIAEQGVLVDGRPARKSARLSPGQEVRISVEGPAAEPVPSASIPLNVLYEDRHLIVLDKAPGHVVHPVGKHVMDTVINALHQRYHDLGAAPDEEPPMIVHRLDRETSGVLLLAKQEAVRKALGRDFEERRVSKTYLALVAGVPGFDERIIDRPIGPDPDSEIRIKVACVPDGRPSRTEVAVVARGETCALVRCRPLTGRQHQVRVHLAAEGHPVLCDLLYGSPDRFLLRDLVPDVPDGERCLLDRQALHAEELVVTHPVSGESMTFQAPLAADMHAVVRLGL